MASIPSTSSVPAVVANKITKVRRQTFLRQIAGGILSGGALALGVFLVALAVDWWIVPFDTRFRANLTSMALWLMAGALVAGVVRALLRPPTVLDVTRAIDSQVPQLEERWTSVTALAGAADRPEIRGAESLIHQVFAESEQLEPLVDPGRIRMASGLKAAGILLGAAALLFLIPTLGDREQMSVLIRRFLHPRDAISLTMIQSETGDQVVAPRASIVLTARVQPRPRPDAILFIQDPAGAVTEHRLAPADSSGTKFTFPVKDLEESFSYRFRSGDGQTDWHAIKVAQRPAFRAIEFEIAPPAYSKLSSVRQAGLPKSIQALEGSQLSIRFESSLPLESFALEDDNGRAESLMSDDRTTYRYDAILTETRAFRPIMTTAEGMSNARPPRCEIVVYPDMAPSIEIANPTNELAVRPDDRITIAFDARDDFGVARAELVVHDPRDPQGAELLVEPIPLGEQEGSKAVHGQVDLDLKSLAAKHGDEVQYSIRVYDTKNKRAALGSEPEPASSNHRALAQGAIAAGDTGDESQTNPGQNLADQNGADANDTDPAAAQVNPDSKAASTAVPRDPREEDSDEASGKSKPESQPSDNSPATESGKSPTGSGKPGKPREPGGQLAGAPRPPNDMRKRLLDAGAQCTSCSRRKLTIDEWAGSFASQVLEKLQIQIDPVLKELRELLSATVRQLEPAVDHARANKPWDKPRNAAIGSANESLAKAETLVHDLTTRTDGTPYAFIGLQLQDITQQHIQPAHNHLHGVLLLEGTPGADDLAADLTHVRRALELLAALTREYETVKLNQRLADVATRVKKMHQVFLEGAMKLLISRKPNLNPKMRSMMELELSDEFLAKLRELLEKKEAILAELARVLSTDPRLLERYMARTRQEAATLRDQLTLLAGREKELYDEVVEGVPAEGDKDARFEFKNPAPRRIREAERIAEDAAVMSDNFTIWLPRDLDPAVGEPARFKAAAARIATSARDLAREASGESPDEALKTAQKLYRELCDFEEQLPALLDAHDSGKLAMRVANRLAETERLITEVSGWAFKETRIAEGKHHLAAEVDQHRITVDTATLSRKLATLETQCRGMTPELAETAREFVQTMETELLGELQGAQQAFGENKIPEAVAGQQRSLEAFAKAETQFDQVIDGMIKYLDSQPYDKTPPPPDPDDVPSLQDLLAMLEDESKAVEALGIPCRPANLMIEKDWLNPGSGGMSPSSARGIVQQTRESRNKAEQLERQLRKALADRAKKHLKDGQLRAPGERRWNTLGSQLDDVLRQGRNNIPPEQYRQAIERYFESLASQSKTGKGE